MGNLLALFGSIRESSASLSGAMDFLIPSTTITGESASNDGVKEPSIELLCLWWDPDLCPPTASLPESPPVPRPRPSKKSESTERLLRWAAAVEPEEVGPPGLELEKGLGGPEESSESWVIGLLLRGRRVGEGRQERSRSEGSKRRRSSKLGMRKEVSEWARRWWDPRCGVSDICSMSVEDVGEGLEAPVKLLFKSIFVFCSVFCVFLVFGLWWWWVVTAVRCLMFIDESGGGSLSG